MIVRKCDICRRVLKADKEFVSVGIGWLPKNVCFSCGKPVVQFLKKKKLISKVEGNKLKVKKK